MPWKTIIKLPGCKPVLPQKNLYEFYLFRTSADDTSWLIGAYRDLTRFATDLRSDASLRDFMSLNRIRIGLRHTDVPPANVKRQSNYGTTIEGANKCRDFSLERINSLASPVRTEHIPPVNRKTDSEENVKSFWESQTPQCHHIVEFNNLEKLGVSTKDGHEGLDYDHLPAVLLSAEFHQRYITAVLKPTHKLDRDQHKSKIHATYRNLYLGRGKLFEPLWHVSKAILDRAGLSEPPITTQ